MKPYSILLLILLLQNNQVNASDSLQYSVKYKYTKQKDSANSFSKFEDVMILTIRNKGSLYYSYLKHFGERNFEKDINSRKSNETSKEVNIDAKSSDRGKYFTLNESEIIDLDYTKKMAKVSDKLMSLVYSYSEKLVSPTWTIGMVSQEILGQKCTMATTIYKGRNYTAWFSLTIPYSMGPWFFNGLPGLILKVEDDKKQFSFECIELNTPITTTIVFRPYKNASVIEPKKLKAKKKMMAQNIIAFMQAEVGVNVYTDGGQPAVIKNKPYNPLDLSKN